MNRRNFVLKATALSAGSMALNAIVNTPSTAGIPADSKYVIGPLEGYSPQIGTLVSMMNYNRMTVIESVKSLSMKELDFLFDKNANTIGALIMHLGATDKYYQGNTFEGKQEYSAADEKIWGPAMHLGDLGRKEIKGHEVSYYIDMITEVRQKTLDELKKKDDQWLLAIDPLWSKEENLNTYWKWFHVVEHESNHRGQIAFLKGRLPGAKASKE